MFSCESNPVTYCVLLNVTTFNIDRFPLTWHCGYPCKNIKLNIKLITNLLRTCCVRVVPPPRTDFSSVFIHLALMLLQLSPFPFYTQHSKRIHLPVNPLCLCPPMHAYSMTCTKADQVMYSMRCLVCVTSRFSAVHMH